MEIVVHGDKACVRPTELLVPHEPIQQTMAEPKNPRNTTARAGGLSDAERHARNRQLRHRLRRRPEILRANFATLRSLRPACVRTGHPRVATGPELQRVSVPCRSQLRSVGQQHRRRRLASRVLNPARMERPTARTRSDCQPGLHERTWLPLPMRRRAPQPTQKRCIDFRPEGKTPAR